MTLSGAGDSIGCFCGFVICVKLLHVHIIKIQTLWKSTKNKVKMILNLTNEIIIVERINEHLS